MAGQVSDLGTGTILLFSNITVDLTSVAMTGISRPSIETTHLGSTPTQTFIPGDLYDPGSIECEFQVDTTAPVTNMDIETLMVAGSSSWSIAVGSLATWSGSNAFVTDFSWNLPTEELATGSFTLKITGDIGTSNT